MSDFLPSCRSSSTLVGCPWEQSKLPPRVITSQMGVSDIEFNGLSRCFWWLLKLLQRGITLPGWVSPHLLATTWLAVAMVLAWW